MTNSRTAVVTGASRGIGRALVNRLISATDRWQVIGVSRSGSVPQEVATAQGATVNFIQADLGTAEGIAAVSAAARRYTSHIDLVVHNAGAIQAEEELTAVSDDALVRSYRLHTIAPLMLTTSLRDLLDGTTPASVVVVGSIYGGIPDPSVAAYVLSKATVPVLTQMLARELAPIRANCILPGHVDTDMTRAAPTEFVDAIVKTTPLGRLGTVEEVCDLVMFLGSDAARFITGSSFLIDGGYATVPYKT